jgi:hypothetical protein
MLGSTGQYVFKDLSGLELVTKPSDGIRKPGGRLFARGVLLRIDGKPLDHNEFNLTTLSCEHGYYYEEFKMVSKGIKCKLIKAYVYEPDARSCYLDLDENDFEMQISLHGITGESSWYGCTREHLDINLHDKLVTITYMPDGTPDCKITPYTLRLSQVPKDREY